MIKYYYIDDISKQQCGPFPITELTTKRIRPETMVWRSGMADWANAGSIQELSFLFDTKIPVPEEKKEPVRPKPEVPVNTVNPQPQAVRPQPAPASNPQANYNNRPSDNQERWNDILPMPKNWLVESILLSIFCCSPISVVGIFYASRVESLYYAKDYDGASRAAENAKKWALIGILFLPACYVIFSIFGAVIIAMFS
ncbi:CD225/dispanin family protein [Prevotella sp. 10(H)]|uniref:CD225/dispanin family protein n=1 Tax=Prevotella sp. 10(H) TaxID=1158294 RepID=UPI0004A77573|nr:CD225/dispanin family protein [Prevotella sp. 10(H)]